MWIEYNEKAILVHTHHPSIHPSIHPACMHGVLVGAGWLWPNFS